MTVTVSVLLNWRNCLFAGVTAIAAISASKAHADFRVCNGTQNLVGVAIGYRTADGWKSEGWWQVLATSCVTLIDGPLSSRYYYLYAEDASNGGRWGGDVDMCVAEDSFEIVGVHDCFTRGYMRMGFREYDTGQQTNWMVQLTDSADAPESSNR